MAYKWHIAHKTPCFCTIWFKNLFLPQGQQVMVPPYSTVTSLLLLTISSKSWRPVSKRTQVGLALTPVNDLTPANDPKTLWHATLWALDKKKKWLQKILRGRNFPSFFEINWWLLLDGRARGCWMYPQNLASFKGRKSKRTMCYVWGSRNKAGVKRTQRTGLCSEREKDLGRRI